MNRIAIIQNIFSLTTFSTYLEIGSERGNSFLPIKAPNKTAVDPNFKISIFKKMKWNFKNPLNKRNHYFEETSDSFFNNRKAHLEAQKPLDVVLVDGLHTFEAALKDVLNALPYMNPNGLIIMHDCLPPHEAAALPTRLFPTNEEQQVKGWTGDWCGDVWKAIVYLKENWSDYLEVHVIDTDFGLGMIRIKQDLPETFAIDPLIFARIDQLTYQDMIKEPEALLNLKDTEFAKEYIAQLIENNQEKSTVAMEN